MELGLHHSRSGRDECTLYFFLFVVHLVMDLWCTCGLWWTCNGLVMDLWIYLEGLEHLLLYMCIYCDGCDMCGWMCGWMRYICDGWDIYVIYVCMNLFVMMGCKNKIKIAVLGHFGECCTRQRTPLPSAMVTALGKAGKIGARRTVFPVLPSATRQRFKKNKIQTLPTAWQRALGKEI